MPLACSEPVSTMISQSIKIASNPYEVKSALRLVYHSYLRSGLIGPNLHGIRVTPYHPSFTDF